MKSNFSAIFLLFSVFWLQACSLERSPKSVTAVSVQIQGGGSSSSESSVVRNIAQNAKGVSFSQALTTALPSSMPLSEFDCFALNVMGPDIPVDLGHMDSRDSLLSSAEIESFKNKVLGELAANTQAYCPYPGRISALVPNTAGPQTLELLVPSGRARVIQVIGLRSPTRTCPSTLAELDALRKSLGNPTDYSTVLAQTTTDLLDASVPIVVSNSHVASSPRYIDSCSGPMGSSSPTPVGTPWSDTQPPVFSSVTAITKFTNSSGVSFGWTATDDSGWILSYDVELHNDATCTSLVAGTPTTLSGGANAYNFTMLGSGVYRMKITAQDSSGKTTSVCSGAEYAMIEVVPPSVGSVTLSGQAGMAVTTPVFRTGNMMNVIYTASDTDSGLSPTGISVSYSLDNGTSWNTVAAGVSYAPPYVWSVPGLPDSITGLIRITAADKAGNSQMASTGFYVDNTPPAVAAPTVPVGSGASYPTTRTINWTCTDTGGSGVRDAQLFVNGSPVGGLVTYPTQTTNWTPLSAGAYTLSIQCYDNGGNMQMSAGFNETAL